VGDGIGIGTNGARVLGKWGEGSVHEELVAHGCDSTTIEIFSSDGQSFGCHGLKGYGKGHGYMLNRSKRVSILFEHAVQLGIEIRLNANVVGYGETEMGASVTLEGGESIEGDCVLCSEGVHCTARLLVTAQEPPKKQSGWAMSGAYLRENELAPHREKLGWLLDGTEKQDRMMAWFGDGLQMTIWTIKHGQKLVWIITHEVSLVSLRSQSQRSEKYFTNRTRGDKDTTPGSRETWTMEGNKTMIDATIKRIRHWPSSANLEPVLRSTPPERLLNQKIVTRLPLDRWVSGGSGMLRTLILPFRDREKVRQLRMGRW
jgi:hypothetical protein